MCFFLSFFLFFFFCRLDCERNKLRCIPKEIGNLSQLKWLILDYNQLTSLPHSVGNLMSLERYLFFCPYCWISKRYTVQCQILGATKCGRREIMDTAAKPCAPASCGLQIAAPRVYNLPRPQFFAAKIKHRAEITFVFSCC